MATLTINYPDEQAVRIRDALCDYGGWTAESGLTRGEFARHQVIRLVRDVVRHQERVSAQQLADAAPDPDLT